MRRADANKPGFVPLTNSRGTPSPFSRPHRTLQRRTADRSEPAGTPIVDDVLQSPGQPLDQSTRSLMEPRFGHDFSKVRAHTESASDQSVFHETAASASEPSDPLVIKAAVGTKGANRAEDVAKVQARLLAVGLLSEADFTTESPKAIAGSMAPTTASITPNDSLAPVADLAAETEAHANDDAASTTPVTIPESSLTATLAAIREFQRPLFSSEAVDGNIGPAGPTWRALRTADLASVAKMKDAWDKKKKQMEKESALKLKADAERKKLEASQQSNETGQKPTTITNDLLTRYATYIPFTRTYIDLDESGLAGALTGYARTKGDVVLKAFDGLDGSDTDDVAYELAHRATNKDLAAFDPKVLARLRIAMTGGWQTDEETYQISRINGILGVKPPNAGTEATPPDGVISHNTSKAPFYNQADKAWKDVTLGKKLKMGPKGCAVTSMAMAVSAISGKSINPGEMDAYLDAHDGYSGDSVYWDKAAQAGGLHAQKHNGFDIEIVDKSLAAGRPCVVSVNSDCHWVIVTDKRVERGRSIYTIHDPATGAAADMELSDGALVGASGAFSKGSGSYIITVSK